MFRRIVFFLLLSSFSIASQAQEILNENFENGLGMEWVAETPWRHGDADSLSSEYLKIPTHTNFMALNDDVLGAGMNSKSKLISPMFSLKTATNPILRFETWFSAKIVNGIAETGKVLLSLDGGNQWREVFTIEGNENWQQINVFLTEYVGLDSLRIAFEYDDGGSWNYGLAIDDVTVKNLYDYDLSLSNIEIEPYHATRTKTPIKGLITNVGGKKVNSFDIYWSDGVDTNKHSITHELSSFESFEFQHKDLIFIDSASLVTFDVWVSHPNGQEDEDDSNNHLQGNASGLAFEPSRKMLVEEVTGTWCGWCVRGIVGMEYMVEHYPNDFIGIAVHSGDPLTPSDGYTLTGRVGGFPNSLFNRLEIVDPDAQLLEYALDEHKKKVSPVTLEDMKGTFDLNTRKLTITLKSVFAAAIRNSDFRFNVVLVENEINSNEEGYKQTNYYAGGGEGEMGGFENKPNPVPAEDMVYNLVARAALGGYSGTKNSIPANTDFFDTVSYTYEYTIPTEWNVDNMDVVGMVIDSRADIVYNAGKIKLSSLMPPSASENLPQGNSQVNIFPTPFQNNTTVELRLEKAAIVSIEVLNTYGQTVFQTDYGKLSGNQLLQLNTSDFTSGSYFIKVTMGDKTTTKHVIKVD